MKKCKGFTLIELLAVVVILGIILSISTIAVNKISKNQKVQNGKNMISNIFTSAKAYVADNPNVLDSLDDDTPILTVGVSDLDVDFNIKKYEDLLEKSVEISKCGNENNEKLKYSMKYKDTTYNDCGCELQNSKKNPTDICTE